MLSFRARLALKIIKRRFNVNPLTCKDQIAVVAAMDGPDKYIVPKGYTRNKEKLTHSTIEYVTPSSKTENLIYIVHGGAYIGGLNDIYRQQAVLLSKAANGAEIAYIDYRVAPQYGYPSALNDALEGWEHILAKGYNPKNIIIIGDSAGGNLTLALMLKLRDSKRELPGAAVLMSPWTDMTASGKSYIENFNRDVMFGGKQQVNPDMVKTLLGSPIYAFCGENDRTDPYVSPIFGNYEGFPPMLFLVGSDEMLLSDTLTIKEKMDKSGIKTELIIGEKMFHVWPIWYKLIPESKRAMNKILGYISNYYQNEAK